MDILQEELSYREKRTTRILAALPSISTSNPQCALVNYCKHQLQFDIVFECEVSGDDDDEIYIFFVKVPPEIQTDPIAIYHHPRKKFAREQAAKAAIIEFNNNEVLLNKCVERALEKLAFQ